MTRQDAMNTPGHLLLFSCHQAGNILINMRGEADMIPHQTMAYNTTSTSDHIRSDPIPSHLAVSCRIASRRVVSGRFGSSLVGLGRGESCRKHYSTANRDTRLTCFSLAMTMPAHSTSHRSHARHHIALPHCIACRSVAWQNAG